MQMLQLSLFVLSSSALSLRLSEYSNKAPVSSELSNASSMKNPVETQLGYTEPELGLSNSILIIFDWDDTLLATKVLLSNSVAAVPRTVSEEESISDRNTLENLREMQKTMNDTEPPLGDADENTVQLRALEDQVMAVLEKATSLGHTVIVTNGLSGWVEYSCWKWIPRVASLLGGVVPVVSARSLYEPTEANMDTWKKLAFQGVKEQAEIDHKVVFTQVVSLGDALFEKKAAQELGKKVNEAIKARNSQFPELEKGKPFGVKTVQLKPKPSIEELRSELHRIEQKLKTIVEHSGNKAYSLFSDSF